MVAMSEGGISVTSHKSQVTNDHEKAIKKILHPQGTKDSWYHPISLMHHCMGLHRYAGKALIPSRCIGRPRDAS